MGQPLDGIVIIVPYVLRIIDHLVISFPGKRGYYAVIFFQQLASIGNNIAIQIAAATSMKVRPIIVQLDSHMHV